MACLILKAGRLKNKTVVNCEEKMQKILISLLLAAAIPALAQAPKTKSETIKAEYIARCRLKKRSAVKSK